MIDYEKMGMWQAAPVVVAAVMRARGAALKRIQAEVVAEAMRLDAAGEFTPEAMERLDWLAHERTLAVCLEWARTLPPETAILLDRFNREYQEV